MRKVLKADLDFIWNGFDLESFIHFFSENGDGDVTVNDYECSKILVIGLHLLI